MRKDLISTVVLLLLSVLCTSCADSKEFKGTVVGIADGDTIRVISNGALYKIRLAGIDCPEKGQPYGKQAKLFTSDLAFKKDVSVIERGHDRYGRLIADIILPDRTSLSKDLVRAGYAWWYRQYAPKDKDLAYAEADAKLDSIGIWSARYAQAPWEYRRQKHVSPTNNINTDLSKISQNRESHM